MDFIEIQAIRIQNRIEKYKNPEKFFPEKVDWDYLCYKRKVLIPILEMTLQKICEGKYGICEKCGKPIERKRLELVPAARLCIKCMKN